MSDKQLKIEVLPLLPSNKVELIMKSSPEMEHICPNACYAMTKAAELFIQKVTIQALETTNGKQLDYKHIAKAIQNENAFNFLEDIVPQKITVSEWRERSKELKKSGKCRGKIFEEESDEKEDEEEE